jgi:hypothetical protein
MALDSIRNRIKTVLEGVAGIDIVHDYERFAKNWNEILTLFKTAEGTYHAWTISRKTSVQRQVTTCQIERCHIFVVRGIYGLNDEAGTEITFQDLIENVSAAFNQDETLGNTCATTHPDWGPMSGAVGLQIDEVGHRMFGNVLCHYAECRLGVIEIL